MSLLIYNCLIMTHSQKLFLHWFVDHLEEVIRNAFSLLTYEAKKLIWCHTNYFRRMEGGLYVRSFFHNSKNTSISRPWLITASSWLTPKNDSCIDLLTIWKRISEMPSLCRHMRPCNSFDVTPTVSVEWRGAWMFALCPDSRVSIRWSILL